MRCARIAFGLAALASGGVAAAQTWTPGSEIVGQSVQVETNGVVNTITFNGDGTAAIQTPSGRSVPATWTANGGRLCLTAGGGSECFPYARAFQAGQPVQATSSCGATSRWLANGVNQPAQSRVAGERG
ncbi:hypothetical protein OMW55_04030 [Sphingomonas sp. BN140010]|uniref:Uncharacterized protein n=1 Tax=Sphingomonas arvum TaxID=2992113 RepID=A0ABT3JD20_9SPHN|nr:hypothetical protein [Sphingomonas sp. BN140010]MCW3796974.1 hypothetical protein [Sphingomonas sp. BN140010]